MTIKKVVSIMLCIAIITTLVPVLGSATIKGLPTPPGPAYASRPIMPHDTSSAHEVDITAATMDDVVISMLEQVDATTFMSYEENLTQNGPRPTGSANCIAAAAYIYSQFENFSLPVRYAHWNNGGYSSDNVEATINGTNESSDEIYIICAHYDTVSAGPGADDDTSGTVAVLMTALIMSQYQFEHTIKFVAFSGEEQGLLGSAIYAQQAKQAGWDIVGVLNCDMISYAVTTTDGNNLIVFENTASEWLYTYTFNVNTEYADYIQLTLHHGGSTWGSDHNSFWDQGYDALFYFEYTETPYYHTSQDTMEHINASYAVKNIRLVLATLAELTGASLKSNPPTAPTLSGPTSGVINVAYTYTASATDPDGDNVFYFIDWGDGTNSGWFGPYTSGQAGSVQKTWTAAGTYTVRAKAKDTHGVVGPWSTPLVVVILVDRAPTAPTITGPEKGKPGTPYLFTFTSTDPDGDAIYYFVDWGDNTTSGWAGPYASGSPSAISHSWSTKGTFTIKAKAKDTLNVESDWSTFQVKMPISLLYEHPSLFAFLEQFFMNHPNAFPLLRYILGL
jgi:hypothetical protein